MKLAGSRQSLKMELTNALVQVSALSVIDINIHIVPYYNSHYLSPLPFSLFLKCSYILPYYSLGNKTPASYDSGLDAWLATFPSWENFSTHFSAKNTRQSGERRDLHAFLKANSIMLHYTTFTLLCTTLYSLYFSLKVQLLFNSLLI